MLQPPPSYTGHITSPKIDERWVADLLSFESRPVNRPDKLYRHVLLVQDSFSRLLWGIALSVKGETRAAFESILDQGRKPQQLNTDKGSEFTGRDFQAMLSRRVIQHSWVLAIACYCRVLVSSTPTNAGQRLLVIVVVCCCLLLLVVVANCCLLLLVVVVACCSLVVA